MTTHEQIIERARAIGWVMEPLAKQLLGSFQVPTTRHVWAHTLDEALRGARDIGYPVVVKIVSPEVIHKSDVGGVVVGIDGDEALTEAYERLETLPAFDGILIDQMVRDGVEVFVGAKVDPQFGPVVLVGMGGTAVEVYKDVVIRMAPLDAADAEAALRGLTGSVLLTGHRGSEPIDMAALSALVASFSRMAMALATEVTSIDLNPVLATAQGAIVADARFMLR